jgi:ubiquinone/menaquinone biosynthesis C-methylase UbiE
MARRSQLIPWKTAGRATDQFASGDEVVRETGWVFNNAVGDGLTMAEFVATGDDEVPTYLNLFQLRGSDPSQQTFVEIGSGIGRMTCAFTREFGSVVACDLDAGFLERCRQVVARFGRPDRLRTLEVPDGDSLALDTNSADVAFSYITLQHCDEHDALALAAEAVRVTRSGGRIALNLRSRSRLDMATLPAGALVRRLLQLPRVGTWMAGQRVLARLAWQANRVTPTAVMERIGSDLTDVEIWRHPSGTVGVVGAVTHTFEGINPHHWWLVATVQKSRG